MKILIFVSLVVIAVFYWVDKTWGEEMISGQLPRPAQTSETVSPTPAKGKTLTVRASQYNYWLYKVRSTKEVKLVTNFSEGKTAKDLFSENKCKAGINGGFYGTDNKPLGRMVVDGENVSRARESSLFNGLVWIDGVGKAGISSDTNKDGVKYAVQTGPLLIYNGQIRELKLANDKRARRMVIFVNGRGEMWWGVITGVESKLDGPLLDDLPASAMQVADLEKLGAVTAINMDGGSASAFISPEVTMEEWQPVGSWWCEKG